MLPHSFHSKVYLIPCLLLGLCQTQVTGVYLFISVFAFSVSFQVYEFCLSLSLKDPPQIFVD